MKKVFLSFAVSALVWGQAGASDLYLVNLHSQNDAEQLGHVARPLLRDGNSYLVLVDRIGQAALENAGLDASLVVTGVAADELAIDRQPQTQTDSHPTVYANGEMRLVRTLPDLLRSGEATTELVPLGNRYVRIVYVEPERTAPLDVAAAPFDSLVARIRQDSVTAHLLRLQAYNGRVAGTDSNRASAAWIESTFVAYGYDSVFQMPFTGQGAGGFTTCYNVVAVKQGTTYPDVQIVVGAHFDGVWGSPAVDDNGTGTVGVLEMARALRDVPTAVTFVFVAFDAEEYGLYGSWAYAEEAALRGDQILFMWNMDMIGHINNSGSARLYHGASTRAAQTFIALAPQYGAITGSLAGMSWNSDHASFIQAGYDAVFLQEWVFSSVYHSPSDRTGSINFDYTTRMIKASLATVLTHSESLDLDGDGIDNALDNCVAVANGSQADVDADLWGDACDNCATAYNPDQANADRDLLGDPCDACPQDFTNDGDGDTHCENADNCPGTWNPEQGDTDGNGQGDACQFTPPTYLVEGASGGASLGFRVDSRGDINDDGYADILAGAPGGGGAGEGAAFVFSGVDGQVLIEITGEESYDEFGKSVAIVPDLNGDGWDEMLVGAPRNSAVDIYTGRAYLFLGRSGPYPLALAASDAHQVFSGEALADFLGTSVCVVGDVDRDGSVDLAISAAQVMGAVGPGRVRVYSGATFLPLYTLNGEQPGDWFGFDLDAVDDVNGDSIPELIIGAPHTSAFANVCGRACVYSGADGALLATFTGETASEQLGWSVSGLGDLNGDGAGDVAIGAPYDVTFATYSGKAYVYSARDSSLLYTYYGHVIEEGTGLSASGTGDVNGDGVRDFFISGGHPRLGTPGKVELYSGATGSLLYTFLGDQPDGGFGGDLCGLGDLDSDGLPDLVVGAFARHGGRDSAGAIYVFAHGDLDADGIGAIWDNCPTDYNPEQADGDSDHHGDTCDNCRGIANANQVIPVALTGDVDETGDVTVADIMGLVGAIFKEGAPPEPCAAAGDANCSGQLGAADIITLVNYIFRAGPPPCDVCETLPGTWTCP